MQPDNKSSKKIILLTDDGNEGKVLSKVIKESNNLEAGKINISLLQFNLESQSHLSINNSLIQECDQLIGIFGRNSFLRNNISASCIEQIFNSVLECDKSITIYLSKSGPDPYKIITEQLADFQKLADSMGKTGHSCFFSSISHLKELLLKQLYLNPIPLYVNHNKSEKEIDEQFNNLIENPSFIKGKLNINKTEKPDLNSYDKNQLQDIIQRITNDRERTEIIVREIKKFLSI